MFVDKLVKDWIRSRLNVRKKDAAGPLTPSWTSGWIEQVGESQSPVEPVKQRYIFIHDNNYRNQGTHFTHIKYLNHNAGLKITISMEMEEGVIMNSIQEKVLAVSWEVAGRYWGSHAAPRWGGSSFCNQH